MIYWTPLSGLYLLWGSILEKKWKIWKNGHFSGRIWPDWGNTTWADMAVLGSIGLIEISTDIRIKMQYSKVLCSISEMYKVKSSGTH